MQFALGRKGDYSVRAVLDVARHHGQCLRKAREISEEMEIPPNYIPQILAQLVRVGLMKATPGSAGGYALTRHPREISLLEVVEVAEGPIGAWQCLLHGGPCDWANVCPVHDAWGAAEDALKRELAVTTFAHLAAIDAAIESGTFQPRATPPAHHKRPRHGTRTRRSQPRAS